VNDQPMLCGECPAADRAGHLREHFKRPSARDPPSGLADRRPDAGTG
jgi:hypothetical protein